MKAYVLVRRVTSEHVYINYDSEEINRKTLPDRQTP